MKKKITKRLFTLLLAAMLVFSFAACGKSAEMPQEPSTPALPEEEAPMQSLAFESYTIYPGYYPDGNSVAVIRSAKELQSCKQHVYDFVTQITSEVEQNFNQETLMSNSGRLMMATRSYYAIQGVFTEAFFQKGVAIIKTMSVPEGTLRLKVADVRTDGVKLYIDLRPVYWLHSGTDALDTLSVLIGLETDMQFDRDDIVIEVVDSIVATE